MVLWDVFFPNLVGSVLGVSLGIPVAFWIDRRISARKREFDEKQAQLESALILRRFKELIEHNKSIANGILAQFDDKNKVALAPLFKDYLWVSERTRFVQVCNDGRLRSNLAGFFSRAADVNNLIDLHRDQSIGVGATIVPLGSKKEESMADDYKKLILSQCNTLVEEAVELIEHIQMPDEDA
jgi:hypothetical protein